MERVEIAQQTVLVVVACAVKDATKEEIERHVNSVIPTGISSKWGIAEEVYQGKDKPATKNPCPCDDHADRLHYVLYC
jgi:hypothetical protein